MAGVDEEEREDADDEGGKKQRAPQAKPEPDILEASLPFVLSTMLVGGFYQTAGLRNTTTDWSTLYN